VGKLFERLILRRLKSHISSSGIYRNEQFGFRERHSTTHQLLRVVKHIKSGLQTKLSTGLLLLDVEKPFDCVWHGALLHKMLNFNFPMTWIKIIMSFLSGRTFFVTIAGVRSMECDILSGVAQGAVLSPTLFNIFKSDFPELDEVHLALFADDSALFTSHSMADVIIGQLQTALNCLRDYYSKWKIELNSSKTQAVFFTKRRTRELPTSELLLDGHSIPWENHAKYLGLILNKTLTFAPHLEHIPSKIQKMIGILYPLINRKSKLSPPQKILLYNAVFQPTILYSSVAWQDCAGAHKRRLQILQNKCLKLILDSSRYHRTSNVHEQTNCKLISESLENIHERF
jgi:hypothetical protein